MTEQSGQIKADYAGYLGMEPEVFPYEEQGFDYPLVHIYYEAYRFDHLLELVVRYQCYSLYGSGLPFEAMILSSEDTPPSPPGHGRR